MHCFVVFVLQFRLVTQSRNQLLNVSSVAKHSHTQNGTLYDTYCCKLVTQAGVVRLKIKTSFQLDCLILLIHLVFSYSLN